MELNSAALTVKLTAGLVILLKLAVMLVSPALTGVAIPLVPAILLMVAMLGADELQVTVEEIFITDPSENVPIAINCESTPKCETISTAVTAIEDNTAVVTVRSLLALVTPFKLAVIFVAPTATGVTNPEELIVATLVLSEFQVALFEIFEVVPSE